MRTRAVATIGAEDQRNAATLLVTLTALPESQHNYDIVEAATLVSILSVAPLFFALQMDFISGLSFGAV